jgi:hypothetical protein
MARQERVVFKRGNLTGAVLSPETERPFDDQLHDADRQTLANDGEGMNTYDISALTILPPPIIIFFVIRT